MAKQLGSLTIGNTLEIPVLVSCQSYFGSKIVFQITQKDQFENSITLASENGISIIDHPQNNGGLRYMRDLPADVWVSDQPNADGNYECVQQPVNTAPTAPASITYGTPVAGQNIVLTCEVSVDTDGDTVRYIWEYSVDSGVYTQIGITSEPSVTMIVPENGETYQARVKAVDSGGNESAYTAGAVKPLKESGSETLLNSPSCIHVSMFKLSN